MKILLFAVGSRGDVQPFVALARRLAAVGHAVTLSAPKGFDAMIEAAGITTAPLPTDFQALLQTPEIKAAMSSVTGRLKAYRWSGEIMNDQLTAMWQLGLEVAPDLILYHFKAPLAPHLARRLGAVAIPVALQPGFAPTRAYPQFLLARKDHGAVLNLASHRLITGVMRAGTGMMVKRWQKVTGTDIGPPLDGLAGYAPGRAAPRVHAFSPTLFPRPEDWPETEVQTGYFFTEPAPFEPPDALAAFLREGPPPLYIGFGSMPGIDAARISAAISGALERTGQRAVVATGWGGIDAIGTDRVHVLEAVPHDWLFPRVAAVVHHGGSGTTHEGLRWGKPSVIAPLMADQPFFGAKVAALGAGPAPIPQKRLTTEGLAAAIEFALSEGPRRVARELGESIRAEDGVAQAAALIERL